MNAIAVALSLTYLAETDRGIVPYDHKGKLQITRCFVDDVNRISGKHYQYTDRMNFKKSNEMAEVWLKYYKPLAEEALNKKLNEYDLAVMYHTGYVGYLRGDGEAYRNMIQRKLALLKPSDAIFTALRRAGQV